MVKFCLRDAAGSPERARWLHLARSGSQSQRAISFILPAHRASHIIMGNIGLRVLQQKQEERGDLSAAFIEAVHTLAN